jgi:hypothetical protein
MYSSGDLGKSNTRAGIVSQPNEDAFHENSTTIFADVPSDVGGAPGSASVFLLLLVRQHCPIFWREDRGKIKTDKFGFGITQKSLHSRIQLAIRPSRSSRNTAKS